MVKCTVEGCEQKHFGRGFCEKHYTRWRNNGNPLVSKNDRHGKSKSPEWFSYCFMIQRCYNPKRESYFQYGGRGIKVCDRWLESLSNFIEDMGERPEGTTLDRINPDGDYTPENCRWAYQSQQSLNKRTTNFVTYGGVTRPVKEWSKLTGIKYRTLRQRLFHNGWDVESALTKPVIPG